MTEREALMEFIRMGGDVLDVVFWVSMGFYVSYWSYFFIRENRH